MTRNHHEESNMTAMNSPAQYMSAPNKAINYADHCERNGPNVHLWSKARNLARLRYLTPLLKVYPKG